MSRFQTFWRRQVPQPPGPGFAFPGSRLNAFRRDPTGYLASLARTYGDIVHFSLASRNFYLLSHPDLIQKVLVNDHTHFRKSAAQQRMRRVLGDGLLTSNGELHTHHRTLITPAFHNKMISGYANTIATETAALAADWQHGATLDIAAAMNHLTLTIIGKVLFRTDFSADAPRIAQALTDLVAVSDPFLMPFLRWIEWLPTPRWRRFQAATTTFEEILGRCIVDHRTDEGTSGDLLHALIAAERAGEGINADAVYDHILTLFLAGHETTANALAWTWWLLAHDEKVEERLHQEVDAVLTGKRLPGMADVAALPYTRMVFSEAMRLYPPAWIMGRQALTDYRLGDYTIPAGSTVLLSQWVTHRDPRYYPEPERFLPERWNSDLRNQRPRFAYFPFGGGPRVCVGAQLAWTEGILALAYLSRRWRLRPLSPAQRVTVEPRVTLRPQGGMPLTLEWRG